MATLPKWANIFRNMSMIKIKCLVTFSNHIPDLQLIKIPTKELVHLHEERLALLLSHIPGFIVLFELGVSIERFNTLEKKQLIELIKKPETLVFLAKNNLNLLQILSMDIHKFLLLSDHQARIQELMDIKIPLENIVNL